MSDFAQTCEYWSGKIEDLIGRDVSRKFNGHSVIWDGGITSGMNAKSVPWYNVGGDKGEVISTGLWSLGRSGGAKVVNAPARWLRNLPQGVPLHGELWKDDDIEYLKKHCKRKSVNSQYWIPVKFLAFNVKPYSTFPDIEDFYPSIQDDVFYENLSQWFLFDMAKSLCSPNKVFSFIFQRRINSKQQALEVIEEYGKTNWEGLMFSDLSSGYENRRSKNTLKFKPTFEDEAIVTGYEGGKTGSRIGKVGAITASYVITEKCNKLCGFRNEFLGKKVSIRISGLNQSEQEYEDVEKIYPIGSEIRFGYKMFSAHGVPQSSNIYRGM
jgi:hypothetical protein